MAAKSNIASGGSQPTGSARDAAAMGARGHFEVLNQEDAIKVINRQLKILSEESFEEKLLRQELAKKRMERLYAQIMLQRPLRRRGEYR